MFRFRDNSAGPDAPGKRYVITNPPNDFNLLPTDQVCIVDLKQQRCKLNCSFLQVFVLMQFDPGMEYRPGWGDGKIIWLSENRQSKFIFAAIRLKFDWVRQPKNHHARVCQFVIKTHLHWNTFSIPYKHAKTLMPAAVLREIKADLSFAWIMDIYTYSYNTKSLFWQ